LYTSNKTVCLQLFFQEQKHPRTADWTDFLRLNFVLDINKQCSRASQEY